jgi:RNA polymerase sigma-70 factor (ECF subfamily)
MIRLIKADMTNNLFGNLKEFEVLFRQYYQILCTFALKYVNDEDTAEEIVQDLFYKLWEKRMELQVNTSIKAYLFAAVHNRCLKFIKHRDVEIKYKNYYLQHKLEIDSEPDDFASINDVQSIINQTLHSLPDRCSRIFILNRFEGLKYHEIAKKLSISVKTVEANMGKALKLLRKNLKDYVEIA